MKNLRFKVQIYVDKLIELLVENQIHIESIEISGINDNFANAPAIDGLISFRVQLISDGISLSLVKKHPKLMHWQPIRNYHGWCEKNAGIW